MNTEPTSSVSVGDQAVTLIAELAPFIDRRSSAFCTSSAWLLAAAHWLPGEPVVIVVRADGAPVAVAVLNVTTRRGTRRIELLGGDLNDYGEFFCDDESAAAELARAIARWVTAQRRWALTLGQLAPEDPVLAALGSLIPDAVVEQGPPMPQIRDIGRDYRISRNRRKKGNNAINRIEGEGLPWEKVVVDDPESLERWLPGVIELRRARDHASGRRSHLDDPAILGFYETVVRDAFARGRAAMNLLVVDGQLAGFNLCMYDGDVHRLYDGRVSDELLHYRGGMVCDLMAVNRAAEDPDVTTFDWLRGDTDSKYGNGELRRVELRAVSHRLVGAVDGWEGAVRRRIKAALPEAAVRRLVTR